MRWYCNLREAGKLLFAILKTKKLQANCNLRKIHKQFGQRNSGEQHKGRQRSDSAEPDSDGFLRRTSLRETDLSHPAKGGSTPAFACQHAAIAPLPCLNLQLTSQGVANSELAGFKKCNCSRKNRLQNLICSANVGYSPTPRQHFWKIAGSKNFCSPAACPRNTTWIRFGKAGAHPQLAWETAIAPETLYLITTISF